MTALTRPVLSLLASTFDTSSGATSAGLADDIVMLREPLTVALRRCLDAPEATWVELVEQGAVVGEWNEWRVASLLAAADPAVDPEAESTREALAELVGELIGRHDVLPGPWEGADRQAAVETPRWRAGRIRREIVFAIERAMDCAAAADAAGLRASAERIAERDPLDESHTGLADALRACADDIAAHGTTSTPNRALLGAALADTPFAAAVDRLPPPFS